MPRPGLLALALLALSAPAAARAAALAPGPALPVAGAAAAAVSPDGRNVYVAGSVEEHGTLVTFARDPVAGGLTRQGCLADTARDGCTRSEALYGANDVTVSRDGRTVYALGILPGAVGVYRRDLDTGALTEIQCLQESWRSQTCPHANFENAWRFALSGDGGSLIVAGSHVSRFVVGADGLLSDAREERISGVRNPAGIAASPDGRSVYIAGGTSDRGKVAALARDPRTGTLSVRGCSGDGTSTGRPCSEASAVRGPADLAVTPDGRGVFLAASSFTSSVADDPFSFSGTLHSSAITALAPQRAAQRGCFGYAGRDRRPGPCRPGRLGGASAVAVTPDGRTVIAGFDKSSAIAIYARNPRTQALRQEACLRDPGRVGSGTGACRESPGLARPNDIAVSPDSRNAYVTSPDGVDVVGLTTGR